MADKRGWSVGKARKKGVKKSKTSRPAAKGFGASAEETPPPAAAAPPPAAAPTEDASRPLAPADLDENDLAAAAAAAGGETWRAYADAALAQVEKLEEEAEEQHISPQELLGRQAAMEEAEAARRQQRP